MLEHVEQGDEVVGAILECAEVGQSGFDHRATEALGRERPPARIELGRLNSAEAAEHGQIVPGARAKLEDARVGRRPDDPRNHLAQDLAPRGEPPMAGIELSHPIEHLALHHSPTRSLTT